MPALVRAVALVLTSLLAQLSAPLPPPPDDRAWVTLKTIAGVRLASAPSPLGVPWGLGEGEIAAPLDRVVAHLTDFPSLSRWMPRVAELRVLARAATSAIVYFRFALPWPFSDRDWTVQYQWQEERERFVMIFCDANDRGPPPTRAVRVSPLRGYWELTATAARTTHARYVFLAQLGGALPRSVAAATAWRQPLETFRGVRAATATGSVEATR
jgi:hypothetical protein